MAAPMSADAFLQALRDEGLEVVEVGNWRTHNRNSRGAWGPVNGVMIHHTVTRGTAATVGIVRHGYADLPGPLCHGMIAKDGRVHLIGYGRTNHAGLGDGDVLQAVIAEKRLPSDNEANTDGNRHFYGFECENLGDGKDPWPAAQLEAIEKVSAAICRHHGWSSRSVIGHKEWQPGKVDPRGFDMDGMRDGIGVRLGSKPKPKPPTRPAFPGRDAFGPGKSSASIKLLGQQLVRRGYGKHYRVGPSKSWGEADRLNVRDFQRSNKQLSGDADGYPGPLTWFVLFS
ncbi:peptidoglycan-binding protein [Streptomyces atratus]|uniref:peptidoglycan-binding protein n=1 Tax=Streptomyces atratus TaxID=1893 RepID=UPI002AC31D4A|nr:peptidoglycan-binding protein [Streptomyces atratus]WPW28660.1 peptidoglycan-binding protein [Streptomyces atratus]